MLPDEHVLAPVDKLFTRFGGQVPFNVVLFFPEALLDLLEGIRY